MVSSIPFWIFIILTIIQPRVPNCRDVIDLWRCFQSDLGLEPAAFCRDFRVYPGGDRHHSRTAANACPGSIVCLSYRDSEAIADYEANSGVVSRMVNDLVMAATGEPTVSSAWGSLVKPSDVVGIKVCTDGALFSSHPAVVNAIVAGLAEAGVPSQNIVVWDREEQLLKVAGFKARNAGYRLMWSEGNYDPKAVITSPISGKLIYGDLLFMSRMSDASGEDVKADPAEKEENGRE